MINLYLIFTTNLLIRSLTCIAAAVARNTLKNIVLSLRQIIIYIVFENKEQHLHILKSGLIQRGHPEEVLGYCSRS